MPDRAINLDATRPTVPGQARFSCLEWLVVAMGAQDKSLPLEWSPIGRSLLGLMVGEPMLPDTPCLETLRRTTVVARSDGWLMPVADVSAFLKSGWSQAQLELLIETVCPDALSVEKDRGTRLLSRCKGRNQDQALW